LVRLRSVLVIIALLAGCTGTNAAQSGAEPTTSATTPAHPATTNETATTSSSEEQALGNGPDLCAHGAQIDANGDGQPDRVSTYGRAGNVGILAVCAADGNVSDVRAIPFGYLEGFASFVLNRGEPAILIPIHTAATYATGSLLTFFSGNIQPITDSATGLQVGVDDGWLADPSVAAKWGCLDVNGDDRRDLVTVRITADGWTRTAYSIAGTSAHRLADSSGPLPEGSTVENAWGDNTRYATIAPPCSSP
jgi:hypothetical protein